MVGRKKIGEEAERLVERYLKERGYKILEKNYRGKGFELDIIAEDGDIIVFIEVRSIKRGGFHPFYSINRRKMEHLRRGALHFLSKNGLYGKKDARFDVVGVLFDKDGVKIEHIENVLML